LHPLIAAYGAPRWRAIAGGHWVPLVRAGVPFENGILVEVPEAIAA